jgi:hypothetical protein
LIKLQFCVRFQRLYLRIVWGCLIMGRLEECAFDKSDCRKAHGTDQAELENCDEIETGIPLIEKDERWIVHADRTCYIRKQFESLAVLSLTLTCLVLCAVFYMICPRCLFGILIFSACLCPWFSSLNISLWLAIILLTLSGWSFSTGAFSIAWHNG